MAPNPFEDEDAAYVVLVNDELQYSLWPAAIVVPEGWSTVHGEAGRNECVEYVDCTWLDMRPASLVRAMESEES